MINITNEDNLQLMARLKDESIDVICIDPPYLYLKNQKLERVFDEPKFFAECKRLLTKNGFIVMFGRGTSFYRWNTILDGLGFTFKEEIIWDKSQTSSPLMSLSRVHETVSIYTKGDGVINRCKIPYTEMKCDIADVMRDIKRLRTVLVNNESLSVVQKYVEDKTLSYDGDYVNSTTITSGGRRIDRGVAVVASMDNGLNEKSVIKQVRDHYTSIHPTQKPVRLIERLLALVIPEDKQRNEITVADFFGGSMSAMEAVHNMGMQGVACEIDKEYFDLGQERIRVATMQQSLFAI